MQRLFGAFVVAVVSAVMLLATTAAVALATVPGGLVDGQGQNIGRGGGFTVTTLSGWSALDILGYGEISCVLAWRDRDTPVAAKRLPLFDSEARYLVYEAAFHDYLEALAAAGLSVVPSRFETTIAESAATSQDTRYTPPTDAGRESTTDSITGCAARNHA